MTTKTLPHPELYKSTVTETIRVTSRNSQLLAA
jgi:hypothetical protein